jgi:transposase
MDYFAGIDTSLETANVCIVDGDGTVILEQKVGAEPNDIAALLKHFGKPLNRIGLEAGPTSSWLFNELRAAGYPALCLECRHVKAGLSAMRNKTDRNDARGIAQLVRLGWFRLVHVKSAEAQQVRMLLVNRNLLLGKLQDIENSVRGSLKVFGMKLGRVTKNSFEARILELIEGHSALAAITEPMLRVRRVLMDEFIVLDRMARKLARKDPVCRRLMTVPGVGVIRCAYI